MMTSLAAALPQQLVNLPRRHYHTLPFASSSSCAPMPSDHTLQYSIKIFASLGVKYSVYGSFCGACQAVLDPVQHLAFGEFAIVILAQAIVDLVQARVIE